MLFSTKTVTILIIVSFIIIIALLVFGLSAKPQEAPILTVKAYKNTVALYNDQEIVTVYDDIVLNTLPPADINRLSSGITVENRAAAEKLLEDYDG